jgi:D-glycero-alpha-D-manno-heptose 1-phosphate guanylyltransferase
MTTCILLAGGLGTRLRGAVPGVPKCLAPVAGRPFLQVQLAQLASQGIERFVLALGYLAEQVIQVAKGLKSSFHVEWIVEQRPLGTGGATLFAMHGAALSEAVVANADTFLRADLSALLAPLDRDRAEDIRMIAVQSGDASRFGRVVVRDGKVKAFMAGGSPRSGLINTGIYRVHRNAFAKYRPEQSFSLEADVIEDLTAQGKVAAAVVIGTFTDIGVPEDYFRFCERFDASADARPVSPRMAR